MFGKVKKGMIMSTENEIKKLREDQNKNRQFNFWCRLIGTILFLLMIGFCTGII